MSDINYRCPNPDCRVWTNDDYSRPCPRCGSATFPGELITYPDDEAAEDEDDD